jgi:hypothetical protein
VCVCVCGIVFVCDISYKDNYTLMFQIYTRTKQSYQLVLILGNVPLHNLLTGTQQTLKCLNVYYCKREVRERKRGCQVKFFKRLSTVPVFIVSLCRSVDLVPPFIHYHLKDKISTPETTLRRYGPDSDLGNVFLSYACLSSWYSDA